MNRPADIDKAEAQLLMSRLMDGELAAADAERLYRYLDSHPEEAAWMEGLDAIREIERPSPSPAFRDEALASIEAAIEGEAMPSNKSHPAPLLAFPRWIQPLAAAAAIALVVSVTWLGIQSPDPSAGNASVVEFVATDLPDASTYIYSDQEIGWTVVWVDSEANANGSSKG